VSLHERDARPIAKGRLGKPVEFGYTGKPGKARQAEERRPAFRKTIKWRTGGEGRISSLKRGYGWDRTRLEWHRRSPDLDRTGGPGPQPGQDRDPGRVIGTGSKINKLGPDRDRAVGG